LAFRDAYLSAHPLCADCQALGDVTAANEVHHIAKLRDRPDLRLDATNVMGLCKTHHSERTARGE
jgi:5-methylcytosine-specific restriction protein A